MIIKGDILTHFHSGGETKARGRIVADDPARMVGRWEFFKKAGFLWNIGNFDEDSRKHGDWTRYREDGSVEVAQVFEHGRRIS
ncbi:hypothetical protein C5L39_08025 [Corynebacterium alimapuense]|uniref:Toxin-antitoxin system YwqK family antitoxin n=2 Tax=Corynebacterium alimapuense TaxID=1576874 RepID=A0A3M8K6R2_9CORY|nr:hypothetical protein C5L39_08025 [Corynebacterium alimapuense]